jgi:hypothetical protein
MGYLIGAGLAAAVGLFATFIGSVALIFLDASAIRHVGLFPRVDTTYCGRFWRILLNATEPSDLHSKRA